MSTSGDSWVEELLARRTPLAEVMREMVCAREAKWFKIWCHEPAPQPDWAALQSLDYDRDFAQLTDWMQTLLDESPIPDDITGLFFGMLYPSNDSPHKNVAVFMTGSRRALDPGADDLREWTRDSDYSPENGVHHSEVLGAFFRLVTAAVLDGFTERDRAIEMCLRWSALVVAEWLRGPMRRRLVGRIGGRKIFVGMDFFMGIDLGLLTAENKP
jgi:hypothetical protein